MIYIMYAEISSRLDEAPRASLDKGQLLFRRDEPVKFIFFVEQGWIELVRHARV